MGPETTDVDVGLGHSGVGEKEPKTEDGLGKDVKNGVGDNLSIDGEDAGSVSNTPDDGVSSPEDESVTSDGSEERADLATLVHSLSTAVNGEVPDDDEVSNASNGVPSDISLIFLKL